MDRKKILSFSILVCFVLWLIGLCLAILSYAINFFTVVMLVIILVVGGGFVVYYARRIYEMKFNARNSKLLYIFFASLLIMQTGTGLSFFSYHNTIDSLTLVANFSLGGAVLQVLAFLLYWIIGFTQKSRR